MGIQELLRHVDLEALRDDTQELRAALADVLTGVRCAIIYKTLLLSYKPSCEIKTS